MENIKSSYRATLWLFAGMNVAVFWALVVVGDHLGSVRDAFASLTAKDGLFILFAPIGTLVLNGLLSADNKARLIYLRLKHPLPGSKAFTRIANEDDRIDPNALISEFGELPTKPAAQNRLWYRIYKQHESDSVVIESHRDWLFSRDLAGYAAIFLALFGTIAIFASQGWRISAAYIGLLVFQYVVLALVAQNYGRRFVANVLALASQYVD